MSELESNTSAARSGHLRATALTIVGMLGFGALTWIYAISRPEPPTQRELQAETRTEIRQGVQKKESDLLSRSETEAGVERLSISESMTLLAPELLQGNSKPKIDEDFVVPGSTTADEIAARLSAPPEESAEGEEGSSEEGEGSPDEALAEQEAVVVEPEVLALDGGGIFQRHCQACHQADGEGMAAASWPPLKDSEWLEQPAEFLGRIVLHGLKGPITVKGEEFERGIMLPMGTQMSNLEIAAVLNHVRSTFSEADLPGISAAQISAVRQETSARDAAEFWTVDELQPFIITSENTEAN